MKNKQLYSIFPLLALLLLGGVVELRSQNEIVPNPEAPLLRRIWMMQGEWGDRVGEAVGSVGDLNRDGLGDFAWYYGKRNQWYVHLSDPEHVESTPYQILDSLGTIPSHTIVGDFYGNGKTMVGFSGFFRVDSSGPRTKLFMRYRLLPIEDQKLSLASALRLAPDQTWQPDLETTHKEAFAEDLDNDGDDELIIVVPGVQFNQAVDRRGEIWIYEGGEHFQLDSPTVVLKDTEESFTQFNATIGYLDDDPYPDILAAGNYTDGEPNNRPVRMKFWWGDSVLQNFSRNPDRSIEFRDPLYPRIPFVRPFLPLFDTDGDSVMEFLLPGSDGVWYFYNMNAPEKNPRLRDLTIADADKSYRGLNIPYKVGYLNDSGHRYEMIGRTGGVGVGGDARLAVLSGGKNGPNSTYDGYYSASDDGLRPGNVFGAGAIIPNCEGIGWDCYLSGNASYGDFDEGIVVLLAGGPYIPNDDPTVSVEEVVTEKHGAILYIWPNPVVDELHLAWRGDLKQSPAQMVVYDLNGREVVRGDIDGWRGEAIWKCGSVASGTYLLVVYDHDGVMLAQTRIIKQ